MHETHLSSLGLSNSYPPFVSRRHHNPAPAHIRNTQNPTYQIRPKNTATSKMAPEEKNKGAIAAPIPSGTEKEEDEEENEEGWEDAEPDNGEETPAVCLFCPEVFPVPEKVFEHCGATHGFNFKKTREELG